MGENTEFKLFKGVDEMEPDELRRTVRDLLLTLDSKELALRTARNEINALMHTVMRLQATVAPSGGK